MDAKISELPVNSTLSSGDIFPIVSGASTKSITAGVLSLNLPNVGNKGITKNAIVPVTSGAIPLTASLVTLATNGTPYTLANGTPGQELTIVSLGDCTINIATGVVPSVTLSVDDVLVVLFTTKWVIKSLVQ